MNDIKMTPYGVFINGKYTSNVAIEDTRKWSGCYSKPMSSDYLEDVDDDHRGTTVLLSMKASGDAFLTVSGEEMSNWYHLPPNETGWRNAERIASALKAWVEHTKRINS